MNAKPNFIISWLPFAFLMAAGLVVLRFWTTSDLSALWLTALSMCG
ncbi:hypothetical protein ACUSIJ_23135 [Pseudochelatococcus sp. B33]